MPNRVLRLLRISISNGTHSVVAANAKLRRQVQRATGGFNRSEIARLLRLSARAMTFNVDNLCNHAAAGNATAGPVVMMDSRNSLVRSDEEATFRRVKSRRTTQAPLGPRGLFSTPRDCWGPYGAGSPYLGGRPARFGS